MKLEEIINSVRKILDDEGMYSPVLDRSIEDFAQVTVMKNIAYEDATSGSKRATVAEISREGDKRYKISPAYTIYLELVRESQKILDGLCMTAKSAKVSQGDDFDELKEKMIEASNGWVKEKDSQIIAADWYR